MACGWGKATLIAVSTCVGVAAVVAGSIVLVFKNEDRKAHVEREICASELDSDDKIKNRFCCLCQRRLCDAPRCDNPDDGGAIVCSCPTGFFSETKHYFHSACFKNALELQRKHPSFPHCPECSKRLE